MPSTAESRKAIFKASYSELDPYEVAYLYNLGVKPTIRQVSDIARKTRSSELSSAIGATKVDALTIQLLEWLKRENVNLQDFRFDDEGRIIEFPTLNA